MSNLYIVTYLSPTSEDVTLLQKSAATAVIGDFASKLDEWPYDVGDDPSFFCWKNYRHKSGRLAWGVCRPDVRKAVLQGDVVVFFTYLRRTMTQDWTKGKYLFVGYATVQEKVSPGSIWTEPSLEVYQSYLNHLIAPDDVQSGVYVHREPVPTQNHENWLWRVAERDGHLKESFNELHRSNHFAPETSQVNGRQVRFGNNYVLFEPEVPKTYILQNPIPVARFQAAGQIESWFDSETAEMIRSKTIGLSNGRHLRTLNRRQPHRHIRLEYDTNRWIEEMDHSFKSI